MVTTADQHALQHAISLALRAEAEGNLPIGAVMILDGEVIAEGRSRILTPIYHPGRHAETMALAEVPPELWPRAAEMTCVSTLEPCIMCLGALMLHGVGRIVFGAHDVLGGGRTILEHLPAYYAGGKGVPEWHGPIAAERCDPLYQRAHERFALLPVGRTDL